MLLETYLKRMRRKQPRAEDGESDGSTPASPKLSPRRSTPLSADDAPSNPQAPGTRQTEGKGLRSQMTFSSTVGGSAPCSDLPDDFRSPDICLNGLRDLTFRDHDRNQLHQKMVSIGNSLHTATPKDRNDFAQYVSALKGEPLPYIPAPASKQNIGVSQCAPPAPDARGPSLARGTDGRWSVSGLTLEGVPLRATNVAATTFFSSWSTPLARVLKYLLPHEAFCCIGVTRALWEAFYSSDASISLSCASVILTHPWQQCLPSRRVALLRRLKGIQSLRIEPIVASVFVFADLEAVLSQSLSSLRHLYICCPCSTILLSGPYVQSLRSESFKMESASQFPEAVATLDRCLTAVPSDSPRLGCCYYRREGRRAPIVTQSEPHGVKIQAEEKPAHPDAGSRPTLSALCHLELTGNDGFLWAISLLEYNLPLLSSLTAQSWTSAFNEYEGCGRADQTAFSLTDCDSGIDSPFETCCEKITLDTDSYHKMSSFVALSCPSTDGDHECPLLWKRTWQCSSRRLSTFLRLIREIEPTLRDLELLVPGHAEGMSLDVPPDVGLHNISSLVHYLKGQGSEPDFPRMIENYTRSAKYTRSLSAEPPHGDVASVRQAVDNRQAKRNFVLFQFNGFVELLRVILFTEGAMPVLSKIQFLGIVSFSTGIFALMRALEKELAHSAEKADTLAAGDGSRSTGTPGVQSSNDVGSKKNIKSATYSLPPSFGMEPGQPVLPRLDFQTDIDKTQPELLGLQQVSRIPLEIFQDISGRDLNRLPFPTPTSSAAFSRCLITFSGTLHLPGSSCIEFSMLYPDCLTKRSIFFRSLWKESDGNDVSSFDATDSVCEADNSEAPCGKTEQMWYDNAGGESFSSSTSTRSAKERAQLMQRRINAGYKGKCYTMRLRLQQSSDASPPREFQRLRSLVASSSRNLLRPAPRLSKGKVATKKKPILAISDAPQDVSDMLKLVAESITTIEMFIGDHGASMRQFGAMHLNSLESIRIVNWNGGNNRSHVGLFNLTCAEATRPIHLTIETTHDHYERTRRKQSKAFYRSLMRFVALLRSRSYSVERLSLFPGPEASFTPFMSYIFPTGRLHLAAVPLPFFTHIERFHVPACLITFFLPLPATHQSFHDDSHRQSEESDIGLSDVDDDSSAGSGTETMGTPRLAVNNQVLVVSAPLERGYTHIREFLVDEIQRQQKLASDPSSREKARLQIASCHLSAHEPLRSLKEHSGPLLPVDTERLAHLKTITYDALERICQNFQEGQFFSAETVQKVPPLTVSCTQGLADFYKIVLGMRIMSMCRLSEDPYRTLRVLMPFDSPRYGSLLKPSGHGSEKSQHAWLAETLFLPWLTLVEALPTLVSCTLALLNIPVASGAAVNLVERLSSFGNGFSVRWIDTKSGTSPPVTPTSESSSPPTQDKPSEPPLPTLVVPYSPKLCVPPPSAEAATAIMVVLHPSLWNTELSKWVLVYAEGKVSDTSIRLVKENLRSA